MVFSRACIAASCVVMLFSKSFWWFAAGFVLQALGNNLNSGSEEALVYDSMKFLGQEEGYLKVCGRLDVILEISQGIATVLGGILAEYSYFWCYSACLVIALLALAPVLLMAEAPDAGASLPAEKGQQLEQALEKEKDAGVALPAEKGQRLEQTPEKEKPGCGGLMEPAEGALVMDGAKGKQEGSERSGDKAGLPPEKETVWDVIRRHFKVSYQILKSDSRILKIIVYYSVIFAAETLLFFYSQQYYFGLGYSKVSISLVLLAVGAASCLGAALSEKLFRKWGPKIVAAAPVAIASALICYSFQKMWLCVAVFTAAGFFNSVLYPVKSDALNHLIPSGQRATLISVDSMFFSIAMIVMFPAAGAMADKWGLAAVLAGIGSVLLAFTACWNFAGRKKA